MKEIVNEYYENTEKLFAKIDSNYERISELIDELTQRFKGNDPREYYMVVLCTCRMLEKAIDFPEEDRKWYETVAERFINLKVEEMIQKPNNLVC